MRIQDWIWQCELCDHKWLAANVVAPNQCPKCKKRKWHTKIVHDDGYELVAAQPVKPDIEALRRICAGNIRAASPEPKEPKEHVYELGGEYAQ
jgi:hypothetical protein